MTRRKKPNGMKRKRRRRGVLEARRSPSSEEALSKEATDDRLTETVDALPMWMDEQGMHAIVPGSPDADTFERMTELYQQNIRNSPMWDEMVRQFGLEKAEQLLKQCRAQPG